MQGLYLSSNFCVLDKSTEYYTVKAKPNGNLLVIHYGAEVIDVYDDNMLVKQLPLLKGELLAADYDSRVFLRNQCNLVLKVHDAPHINL